MRDTVVTNDSSSGLLRPQRSAGLLRDRRTAAVGTEVDR